MKKYFSFVFVAAAISSGCSDSSSPTEINLDSSVDGQTITIAKNQQYTLELETNADAGYEWACTISDESIVIHDSTSSRPENNDSELDGGLTIETFYFRGVNSGSCTISLNEIQPWKDKYEPINTVQFGVIVK